ncbi:DMT family transporter [Priestia megaterium]|uniref:DMT family transporter n=1 Tax=Priestia megaterium TaxID=1404 RepID=UPI001C243B8F|nr:DMT family transporter [Priestia megaterium]MBU8690561.1 DMT family transporter [Priestia megaterium]
MKKGWLEWILLSVALIWGANYTIGKFGVAHMSSIQFSALRFIMVAPILLLITGIIERGIRIKKKDWGRLIAVSIVGVTLYQTLFMVSVKYTTATNASLLISMSPIFTGILAILYKHEAFSLKTQLGSMLAFFGAAFVLLFGHSSHALSQLAWFGNIMGIVAAIAWGWYPILAKPLVVKYSALRVTAWSALIGAIPLTVYCLFTYQTLIWPTDIGSWSSLAYSVLFVTVYGLVMWYVGIGKIGSTKVMVYMYVIPLFAVVFAAVAIGETINAMQLLGGLIIFSGLYIVKKSPAPKTALKLKKAN